MWREGTGLTKTCCRMSWQYLGHRKNITNSSERKNLSSRIQYVQYSAVKKFVGWGFSGDSPFSRGCGVSQSSQREASGSMPTCGMDILSVHRSLMYQESPTVPVGRPIRHQGLLNAPASGGPGQS